MVEVAAAEAAAMMEVDMAAAEAAEGANPIAM
jgi:hypothetical protein